MFLRRLLVCPQAVAVQNSLLIRQLLIGRTSVGVKYLCGNLANLRARSDVWAKIVRIVTKDANKLCGELVER